MGSCHLRTGDFYDFVLRNRAQRFGAPHADARRISLLRSRRSGRPACSVTNITFVRRRKLFGLYGKESAKKEERENEEAAKRRRAADHQRILAVWAETQKMRWEEWRAHYRHAIDVGVEVPAAPAWVEPPREERPWGQ